MDKCENMGSHNLVDALKKELKIFRHNVHDLNAKYRAAVDHIVDLEHTVGTMICNVGELKDELAKVRSERDKAIGKCMRFEDAISEILAHTSTTPDMSGRLQSAYPQHPKKFTQAVDAALRVIYEENNNA